MAAIEHGEEMPEGTAAIHETLHGLPSDFSMLVAMAETTGACAFAVLAAVNEGLGTVLHMAAKPSKQARLKELLKAPEHWVPVWVQLVGYPAEDRAAGGQRPRDPFEEMFFAGQVGTPFPRDDAVMADLAEAGLLQAPMPRPGRFDELRFLARMFGYPELDRVDD